MLLTDVLEVDMGCALLRITLKVDVDEACALLVDLLKIDSVVDLEQTMDWDAGVG